MLSHCLLHLYLCIVCTIGSLHACKSQLTQPPSGRQTTRADGISCSKAMWCVARCPPEILLRPFHLRIATISFAVSTHLSRVCVHLSALRPSHLRVATHHFRVRDHLSRFCDHLICGSRPPQSLLSSSQSLLRPPHLQVETHIRGRDHLNCF